MACRLVSAKQLSEPLLIEPLGININEISIEIHIPFEYDVCTIATILSRSEHVELNK